MNEKKECKIKSSVPVDSGEPPYEELIKYVTCISKPLASRELTTKIYQLIITARKNMQYVRYGIKHILKTMRYKMKGILIIAGDVIPMEPIMHLPIVCEENNFLYCFTPSKKKLGKVARARGHIFAVYVLERNDYKELYDEVKSHIMRLFYEL